MDWQLCLVGLGMKPDRSLVDSYQGSHGLATLSCWIGDEAGQEVWWIHIRGAMDWQLCLVELGRKPDRKSWVLGKQHGTGEENDSRKD